MANVTWHISHCIISLCLNSPRHHKEPMLKDAYILPIKSTCLGLYLLQLFLAKNSISVGSSVKN